MIVCTISTSPSPRQPQQTNPFSFGCLVSAHVRQELIVALLPHHQHVPHLPYSLLLVLGRRCTGPDNSSTFVPNSRRPLALEGWAADPEARSRDLV